MVKHLIKTRNEAEMLLSPLRFHALLEELASATQAKNKWGRSKQKYGLQMIC